MNGTENLAYWMLAIIVYLFVVSQLDAPGATMLSILLVAGALLVNEKKNPGNGLLETFGSLIK